MAVSGNNNSAILTQAGAGTDEVIAAPGAGLSIVVHGVDVSQDGGGTLILSSAATALTGAFATHAAAHTLYTIAGASDCVLRCAENEALNVTTATSPAFGVVYYSIESTS